MRRTMKKTILCFLLGIFLLFSTTVVTFANMPEAYNISTNPAYDMARSMHINYHSDIEGTFVEYTLASDEDYTNSQIATAKPFEWSRPDKEGRWNSSGFSTPRNIYRVTLTDLQPNTEYRYRVGKTSFSVDHFFKTAAGENESFSFLHLTDPQFTTQAGAEIFNNLIHKGLSINPDIAFSLFSGDAVDKGGRDDLWKMFFRSSSVKTMPFAMTVGNHEYYDTGTEMTNNDYFTAHFYNPQNGPDRVVGSTYYFKYNNVLFVVIDTEVREYSPQQEWFREVVEHEQPQYIIVSMHRSFYGSKYASHSVNVRNMWQKTFEDYAVDLVLSGHDHVYARSYPMYQNQITDDIYKATTYIIGGSSGNKFYPLDKSATGNSKYYAKGIENISTANIITVDDEKISINLIDQSGKTLDSAEIPAKRAATKPTDFSKQHFLDNIEIHHSEAELDRLKVSWPSAYGFVKKVNVKGPRISQTAIIATQQDKHIELPVPIGRFMDMTIVVEFRDGTTEEIDFELSTKRAFGTIDNFNIKDLNPDSATITWDSEINNQIKQYQVFLDGEVIDTLESDVNNYTVNDLAENTSYEVVIAAVDIFDDIVFEKELIIKTSKIQETPDTPKPKRGCLSSAGAMYSLTLLGLVLILRKRFL